MLEILGFDKEYKENIVRIICHFDVDNKKESMFFETDKAYEPFFCIDRIDGIVVMLLRRCLLNNQSITSRLPMSKQLYFQLTHFFIPEIVRKTPDRSFPITIDCPLTDECYHPKMIATGVSCGVDSLYTIERNISDESVDDYKINQLFFINIHQRKMDPERKRFHNDLKSAEKYAQTIKLPIVSLFSDYRDSWGKTDIFSTENLYYLVGCVLLFSKLVKIYYFSGCDDLSVFKLSLFTSSEDYSLFSLKYFSTENVSFYCDGDISRLEKIDYLMRKESTYDHLNVCWESGYGNEFLNCGKCKKCIRTLLMLDVLGGLQNYKNVFDLNEYKKNAVNYWANVLYDQQDKYYRYLLEFARSKNYPIPREAYRFAQKLERETKRNNAKHRIIKAKDRIKRKIGLA